MQWLRDGLGIIADAAEIGPLAATVADNGGVYPRAGVHRARRAVVGPVRAGHDRRASRAARRRRTSPAPCVEAMAYQTRDVIEAMVAASGTPLTELRVDGGAARWTRCCSCRPISSASTVRRPTDHETTALGAAYLAGLAEGAFDLAGIAERWALDATFEPAATALARRRVHASGCAPSSDRGAGRRRGPGRHAWCCPGTRRRWYLRRPMRDRSQLPRLRVRPRRPCSR